MQFKHDKSGAYTERPPSKTNEMIQQLLDQQEHLLNQQDKLVNQQQALYALIAERSDNRIGVFSGGNGNDNPGNNHQGNGNDNPGNNHQGNGNDNPGNNHQGNGNDNPGNNHQGNGSGNVDQGEDVQPYHCENRGLFGIGSLCGADVKEGDKECGTCGNELKWAAMGR
jgi:hypothetical protein